MSNKQIWTNGINGNTTGILLATSNSVSKLAITRYRFKKIMYMAMIK